MLLNEFFGKTLSNSHSSESKEKTDFDEDKIFEFIIDHDRMHKEYFYPAAKKILQKHKKNQEDRNESLKEFYPMARKGCLEYFEKHKMPGKPEKIFTREVYRDLCEKLYDHYYEDIVKGVYKLG